MTTSTLPKMNPILLPGYARRLAAGAQTHLSQGRPEAAAQTVDLLDLAIVEMTRHNFDCDAIDRTAGRLRNSLG